MKGRWGFVVVMTAGCTCFAFASQPGQPLDCEDWVFVEPGFSCSEWIPFNCAPLGTKDARCRTGQQRNLDNEGREIRIKSVESGVLCGGTPLVRTSLIVFDGTSERLLGFIEERCVNPAPYPDHQIDGIRPVREDGGQWYALSAFDAVNGRLLMPMEDETRAAPPGTPVYGGTWVASISGFTPLFEVLQTYTPTSDALTFRVPAHPEGLRSADRFDSYWGRVSDLPDFTAANPMACNLPGDHVPQPGEYVTIPDTSPHPKPGAGNYIITAVTHEGETRYGRKRIGDVLSGRDPVLLPACSVAYTAATP